MSNKLSHVLLIGVGLFSSTWVMAAVKEYDLTIAEQTVNITGKPLKRITVNGKFVAPLLEFEEGDDAVIRVHNKLKNQDSSIHWHGLILPGIMDGVPGFNQFEGIAPNKTYEYKFKVRQNGTYWYHSHSKGQEQDGLYGALVIYPKNKTPLTSSEKLIEIMWFCFLIFIIQQVIKSQRILKKKQITIRTVEKRYLMS